jgi:hypothetical protein
MRSGARGLRRGPFFTVFFAAGFFPVAFVADAFFAAAFIRAYPSRASM